MKKELPDYVPDNIQALLIRQDKTGLTAEENRQLEDWYNTLAFLPAGEILDGGTREAGEEEIIWTRLQQQMRKDVPVKIHRSRSWLWKAAAAAAVTGIMAAGWQLFRQQSPYQLQLATAAGKVRALTLPDGSRVWLNASSELKYNKWESGKSREVVLNGEAFFEIAPHTGLPFIIHTHTVDINVLGTSFNVKAYEGDATTETTLVTGKVAVILKNEKDRTVQLIPNQKLIVNNSAAKQEIRPLRTKKTDTVSYHIAPVEMHSGDSSLAEVSWRERKLAFFDQPFAAVALQLQRWYGITVIFNEETMKNTRFTGTFRDEPLPRVMMALQLSAPFNYHISNDTLMIGK